MIKSILSLAVLLAAATATASADDGQKALRLSEGKNFQRITPTYTDYVRPDWRSNWFINAQAGGVAFMGQPVGCGDFGDRMTFNFNASLGKWITPDFAMRFAFQGTRFKNALLTTNTYWALHMDAMYDVASLFRNPEVQNPRWVLAPYIGVGVAKGATLWHDNCPCLACNGSNWPFLITYGIQGRYRVAERVHLTAEVGMMHLMSDFDGVGDRRHIGDKMLSLSAGVAITIGRTGWKRAIDARPYMQQNDELRDYCQRLLAMKDLSRGENDEFARATYGGLEALKARLMAKQREEIARLERSQQAYKDSVKASRRYNIPIYFFFKIGKAELTDVSQLANLDELVRVAKEHHLTLRVDGAADAATGTPKINDDLSKQRARFLAKCLKLRGIEVKDIKGFAHGGVTEHKRPQEDRYAKVAIYIDFSEDEEVQ